MTEQEVRELIEKRCAEEPEFRQKYDAFLAKRQAEGKLSDEELDSVNGGLFFGIKRCPNCGDYTLTTYTFGVYASCTNCDYTEWFSK